MTLIRILLSTLVCFILISNSATAKSLKLSRGINIHEWMNWSYLDAKDPKKYAWPPYGKRLIWGGYRDLQRIKELGFDFVRLSIDPGPLLQSKEKKRIEALDIISQAIQQILSHGLKVIVDLHPVDQLPELSRTSLVLPPNAALALEYRDVVASMAKMLNQFNDTEIAFELMNEPQFACDRAGAQLWQSVLVELIRAARASSPDLTLVVSGTCGGGYEGLLDLDPSQLGDSNLIYSFHYYEPEIFTFQGYGQSRKFLTGLPWPISAKSFEQTINLIEKNIRTKTKVGSFNQFVQGVNARRKTRTYFETQADAAKTNKHFEEIIGWAKKNSIAPERLLMGEFGVMAATQKLGGAGPEDRRRWLKHVREQAESYGIAWCYWEYSNRFGMSLTTDSGTRALDPIASEALDLHAPKR